MSQRDPPKCAYKRGIPNPHTLSLQQGELVGSLRRLFVINHTFHSEQCHQGTLTLMALPSRIGLPPATQHAKQRRHAVHHERKDSEWSCIGMYWSMIWLQYVAIIVSCLHLDKPWQTRWRPGEFHKGSVEREPLCKGTISVWDNAVNFYTQCWANCLKVSKHIAESKLLVVFRYVFERAHPLPIQRQACSGDIFCFVGHTHILGSNERRPEKKHGWEKASH